MTNKQYEHLGRAVAIEARLELAHEAMDGLRESLARELSAIAPGDGVKKWVVDRYGNNMATWHNSRDFMDAVRSVIERDERSAT